MARRLAKHLRQNLGPGAYGVLSEWVSSSGQAVLSQLAEAGGVSPATATRAVQALRSLIIDQRSTLAEPSFRAMLDSLPTEFEEAA